MPSRLAREEMRHAALGRPTAISIGKFDGVHLGHKALLRQLKEQASARGFGTGVVILYPNPESVIHPGKLPSYLTSLDERIDLLRAEGIDTVVPVTFTSELAQSSAEDFARALREQLDMALLLGGPDLALGRGREGTPERLRDLGHGLGFEVFIVQFESGEQGKIGSRAVRSALSEGNLKEVERLLGRPLTLCGPVVRGAERGRTLGFPTANIAIGVDRELPALGVYATRVRIDDRMYDSVTNIGRRPTFDDGAPTVEAYIFDFDSDIYGQELCVELVARLRGERKFSGVEELKRQIALDVDSAREALR